jgi:SPP1 family predicted phage head-tail adaptor
MNEPPLRAGQLRHRIDIIRMVETPDGKGGFTLAPQAVLEGVAAEVISLNGRESVMQHVLQGVSVYRIRIRWRGDIKASDQVRYAGTDLNIKAPPADPSGARRQLIIMADTEAALPST